MGRNSEVAEFWVSLCFLALRFHQPFLLLLNTIFGAYRTYNNQYMIINMGFFSPGKALPPGTLWVIEQIPGLVVYADTTQQLGKGGIRLV